MPEAPLHPQQHQIQKHQLQVAGQGRPENVPHVYPQAKVHRPLSCQAAGPPIAKIGVSSA